MPPGAVGQAVAAARRHPTVVLAGLAVGVGAFALLRPMKGIGGAPAENAPATTTSTDPGDLFDQRAEFYASLEDFANGGGGAGLPSSSPPPPPPTVPVAGVSPGGGLPQLRQGPGGMTSAQLAALAAIYGNAGVRTTATAQSPLAGGLSAPGSPPRRVAVTRAPTLAVYPGGRRVTIPAGRQLPVAKGTLAGAITHLVVAGPYAGAHVARHSTTAAYSGRELEAAR